jgi:hypothetical protein
MSGLLSFKTFTIGLALSASAFAQSPLPEPPALPGEAGSPPMLMGSASAQLPVVTQSSRIRAFNAGPEGEVHSLYLRNGSVVDVSPDLSRQLSAATHKGARITVTGAQAKVNGQLTITASRITIDSRSFLSQPPRGQSGPMNVAVPPQHGPDRGLRRRGPGPSQVAAVRMPPLPAGPDAPPPPPRTSAPTPPTCGDRPLGPPADQAPSPSIAAPAPAGPTTPQPALPQPNR